MKKLFLILFALGLMNLQACAVKKIPFRNVGVVVNTVGENRGVDATTYSSGWLLINPMTQDLLEFPITQQTRTWTDNVNEGHPIDESITFSSSESATVHVNTFIAYSFSRPKIPYIVGNYNGDAEAIADVQIRSAVRAAFGEAGGKMKAIDIAGPGLHKLTLDVKNILNNQFNKEGIVFASVNVIGKPKLEGGIQKSINEAIAATQQAIAAENQKRQIQAYADQAVIKAEGEKRAIEANPYYLQTKIIDGWVRGGSKVPVVMGSGVNSFADMTKFLNK